VSDGMICMTYNVVTNNVVTTNDNVTNDITK
jgi:hypothetical protein